MSKVRDECVQEIQNKVLHLANRCRIAKDDEGMAFFVELNTKISAFYLEVLDKEYNKKFNKEITHEKNG